MMKAFPKGRKGKRIFRKMALRNTICISCLERTYSKFCSYFGAHFVQLSCVLSLRVPSQYKNLRLTQRVTCLQKTRKVSALHQRKRNMHHHGNRNKEVV